MLYLVRWWPCSVGGDESGEPNFLRGADGSVAWLRYGGRLYQHQGVSGALPETGGPDLVGELLRRLLRRPLWRLQ
jgi:hypothetical protein